MNLKVSVIVFILSCFLGFSIAIRKPLWNDEIVSQRITITNNSYIALIKGAYTESNNSPLFYSIQKFICQAISYHPNRILGDPLADRAPNTYAPCSNKTAEIILRIQSVFWMSLAVAAIFYYFSFYSLWASIISLFIALSSFTVWAYWAEARVYSAGFFFTTIEMILCIQIIQKQRLFDKASWNGLALCHILLALAISSSIFQILGASILLFIFANRKIKDYVLMTIIPVSICLYYHSKAPQIPIIFMEPAWRLITANLNIERILFVLIAGIYFWRKKERAYFLYYGMTLVVAALMLIVFIYYSMPLPLKQTGHGPTTLVQEKHFMFLVPVGIITVTFIFVRLFQIFRSTKSKIILILLLMVISLPRLGKYTNYFLIKMAVSDIKKII